MGLSSVCGRERNRRRLRAQRPRDGGRGGCDGLCACAAAHRPVRLRRWRGWPRARPWAPLASLGVVGPPGAPLPPLEAREAAASVPGRKERAGSGGAWGRERCPRAQRGVGPATGAEASPYKLRASLLAEKMPWVIKWRSTGKVRIIPFPKSMAQKCSVMVRL